MPVPYVICHFLSLFDLCPASWPWSPNRWAVPKPTEGEEPARNREQPRAAESGAAAPRPWPGSGPHAAQRGQVGIALAKGSRRLALRCPDSQIPRFRMFPGSASMRSFKLAVVRHPERRRPRSDPLNSSVQLRHAHDHHNADNCLHPDSGPSYSTWESKSRPPYCQAKATPSSQKCLPQACLRPGLVLNGCEVHVNGYAHHLPLREAAEASMKDLTETKGLARCSTCETYTAEMFTKPSGLHLENASSLDTSRCWLCKEHGEDSTFCCFSMSVDAAGYLKKQALNLASPGCSDTLVYLRFCKLQSVLA